MTSHHHERREELLVTRVVYGLQRHEEDEYRELLDACHDSEQESMERAAAAVLLAMASPHLGAPLPEKLRGSLHDAADRWCRDAKHERPTTRKTPDRLATPHSAPAAVTTRPWRMGSSAWLAAAAGIGLGAFVTAALMSGRGLGSSPASPVEGYRAMLASGSVTRANWTDWDNPEIKGVGGEVVWSETQQRGYLVLRGLPESDASKQVYQLWVVDRRGLVDPTGQSARISGGIFARGEIAPSGEMIVPITPAIPVQGAAAFAITIESPGGTWVSTMQRRVAIASLNSASAESGMCPTTALAAR